MLCIEIESLETEKLPTKQIILPEGTIISYDIPLLIQFIRRKQQCRYSFSSHVITVPPSWKGHASKLNL